MIWNDRRLFLWTRNNPIYFTIFYFRNRYEMVDMAMQQLAAAPPRVMRQQPTLNFVNEAGKLGSMRMMKEEVKEYYSRTGTGLLGVRKMAEGAVLAAFLYTYRQDIQPTVQPAGNSSITYEVLIG